LVLKLRENAEGLLEAKLGERKGPSGGNDAKKDLDDNTRKQFLSLTDADFPLVCTFDCLLRLIENSIRFVAPLLQVLRCGRPTKSPLENRKSGGGT